MNIVYGAAWVGGFFVVGVLVVWVVQEARLARRYGQASEHERMARMYRDLRESGIWNPRRG